MSLYNIAAIASSVSGTGATSTSTVDPYLPSDLPALYPERPVSVYSASMYGTAGYDPNAVAIAGAKRSIEVLGSHNNVWQPEALYSSNPLVKLPRVEFASNFPIYPQRPGEKDCSFYMLTRTCKFGDSCKFDHPTWVPEGGLPGWKESLVPTNESLPERPGEPDCPFYLKTQKCKYGPRCKFNHPKESASTGVAEGTDVLDISLLPERPTEPVCVFYAKTGKCNFGSTCKYHHPKDIQLSSSEQDNGQLQSSDKAFVPVEPALMHNSKGLPIRPGETDCPFYLKTGSCKYGATCRYNHPDRYLPYPAATFAAGLYNAAAGYLPSIDLHSVQAPLGYVASVYPQRPGETECDFYMKTGHCKYGERCRFHHPIDRSSSTTTAKQASELSAKLTLAGLPRREGADACSFYMKTGTCKYGVTCKFNHPPPGEAVALATSAEGNVDGAGVVTNEL